MTELADFGDHILVLDHTAHAVRSIAEASKLYGQILGGKCIYQEESTDEGFRFAQYRYPNGSKVELLEPVGNGGFLAKFLAERGEGLHHMTFKVVRLEELVKKLKQAGYRIVGENYTDSRWKEAFISPKSAFGTIIQLAETL